MNRHQGPEFHPRSLNNTVTKSQHCPPSAREAEERGLEIRDQTGLRSRTFSKLNKPASQKGTDHTIHRYKWSTKVGRLPAPGCWAFLLSHVYIF